MFYRHTRMEDKSNVYKESLGSIPIVVEFYEVLYLSYLKYFSIILLSL